MVNVLGVLMIVTFAVGSGMYALQSVRSAERHARASKTSAAETEQSTTDPRLLPLNPIVVTPESSFDEQPSGRLLATPGSVDFGNRGTATVRHVRGQLDYSYLWNEALRYRPELHYRTSFSDALTSTQFAKLKVNRGDPVGVLAWAENPWTIGKPLLFEALEARRLIALLGDTNSSVSFAPQSLVPPTSLSYHIGRPLAGGPESLGICVKVQQLINLAPEPERHLLRAHNWLTNLEPDRLFVWETHHWLTNLGPDHQQQLLQAHNSLTDLGPFEDTTPFALPVRTSFVVWHALGEPSISRLQIFAAYRPVTVPLKP